MSRWDLLIALFNEPTIEPEVEDALLKVKFNSDYSLRGSSELLR